mmetsp:Transcript_16165/g.37704  ORF Transcript_16165/g.37704 Transcript_16165/m.37704 type:complete len:393 (-) Transcript_16165:142-1320(-)
MHALAGAIALAALAPGAEGFMSSGALSSPATSWRTTPVRRGRSLAAASVEVSEVKKCLSREYTSFFTPMETEFYEQDVTFVDPLSTLVGIDKYENNVDLLAGRTPLGSFLFSDASILLHSVDETGPNQLRTRWTLRMTISGLPWKPTARFTGVSDYTLSAASGKIARQQDYWDSVNLEGGRYGAKDLISGIKDFVAQVKPADDAASALGMELPSILLRRGIGYDVRRYPRCRVARTPYTNRPEGFDKLGSYASGENKASIKIQPLAPSLVIAEKKEGGKKTMEWPLFFLMDGTDEAAEIEKSAQAAPEPNAESISLEMASYDTMAVLTFSDAATAEAVAYYHQKLMDKCVEDGLTPADECAEKIIFAQYDPIFALKAKRNEVWVPLKAHDWM